MGEFSITHLLILVAILLLFFGPSRLPQLGQSIGKAIRGFKQGLNEIEVEAKDVPKEPSKEQLSHQNQASSSMQSTAEKKDYTPKS